MRVYCLLACLTLVKIVSAKAPTGPWDAFNYAPTSRVVRPVSARRVQGTVTGQENLFKDTNTPATIAEKAWITLDFGVEVGGLISLTLSSTSTFALSFTESPQYISPTYSDDSTHPDASQTFDGVLSVSSNASKPTLWTQSSATLRGGFRFLTIVANKGTFQVSNVTCQISFMPHVAGDKLRDYAGYFYAKDESGYHDEDFLTKLWYAGAYTVQTNTVPLNTGRRVPFSGRGTWFNDATLGVAGPIIVDGAKRDRAVWPGDMGIAVPTQFYSLNDLVPTKNALLTMFSGIQSNGALPESGPPLSQKDSDTYHGWTLIGCHTYHLYTGDADFVKTIWTNYTRAVAFLERKVVPAKGLMNVTGLRDWARLGGGGINAAGNAILYQTLVTASDLARVMNDQTLADAWARNATNLKAAFNKEFWMDSVGMYRDNATTTLAPQDANSLAVLYNITQEESWKARVSDGLTKNWRELGPEPPELLDTISPFISGFELQAHFEANQPDRALDLLHRTWGYMLYTNLSVQSTLLEGFTVNGSLAYRWYRGYENDPAYTSHAHGWSSGPTSALTNYVLGISVTEPQGQGWLLKPIFVKGVSDAADTGVKGGFETPLGTFDIQLSWAAGGKGLTATLITPLGTKGKFVLPKVFSSSTSKTMVDGKVVSGEVVLDGGTRRIVVQSS